MIENLDHQLRRRGVTSLRCGGVVVDDDELGLLGVVLDLCRLAGEVARGEDALAPHVFDAAIQFLP